MFQNYSATFTIVASKIMEDKRRRWFHIRKKINDDDMKDRKTETER